jgi:sodium-dependent dicarboxylate transporter 2/3/5
VSDRLDEGVVAVAGAALLFLLPVDWERREFTLRWSDASRIDLGTIVLFGTGIILGALLILLLLPVMISLVGLN